MAWYDIFTGGIDEVVDSVGEIIGDLTTTDEERLEAERKMAVIAEKAKLSALRAKADYDKEVTERLRIDMTSDSWLSKNIRPILLITTTGATLILAYATIFTLTVEEMAKVEVWIPLLLTLLVTGFTFYFGSRGGEKITKMITDYKGKKKEVSDED